MTAPDPTGRIRHLADLMHRATDASGDPIPAGYLLSTDGTDALEWIEPANVGASVLDDLTDVAISAPALGDLLRYDGSGWVNYSGHYEPVVDDFGSGPELVFDSGDLVMEWFD